MESLRRKRTKPSIIITCFAIIGLAVTLAAAYWQFKRSVYKQDLLSTYHYKQRAPIIDLNHETNFVGDNHRYRSVTVTGRFLWDQAIFLDNKIVNGIAGYNTIVPIEYEKSSISESNMVPVNLGWIAWGAERVPKNFKKKLSDEVRVVGVIDLPKESVFRLKNSFWRD